MILILSEKGDGSTNIVIEWLVALHKKYMRLNYDDERAKFMFLDLDRNKVLFKYRDKVINILDVTTLWYRRKGLSLRSLNINSKILNETIFIDDLYYQKRHITKESNKLIDFMLFSLDQKCKVIGNYKNSDLNKLHILMVAKHCGIEIPKTYVVSNKNDLIDIIEREEKNIITKAIDNGLYYITKRFGYYSYTEKLTLNDAKRLPNHFFPSLIQIEIKKKYEIRSFYLKGEFYSMAIFSQNDKDTSVDFRKYNIKKPNRTVPYSLPGLIKKKLQTILDGLNLNTASIDLIVDKDSKYIFLEINPIGQFSMVSYPCNYYLEKKVAEIL